MVYICIVRACAAKKKGTQAMLYHYPIILKPAIRVVKMYTLLQRTRGLRRSAFHATLCNHRRRRHRRPLYTD